MKIINGKMYFSQALRKLPSDPNHLMKGRQLNMETAVCRGSHHY